MSLFKRYYPVLVAVLVAVLPLGMNTYWTEVAVNVGLYALLALSLNVILGQAGIFHMGHAAFYAVGAYVTAILNTHYQIPILLLIPVAGAAAALFALIVARPIIHLRGDYLLIVTIGIVEIVRIALINDVFGLTGGANGIFGIADTLPANRPPSRQRVSRMASAAPAPSWYRANTVSPALNFSASRSARPFSSTTSSGSWSGLPCCCSIGFPSRVSAAR